MDFNYEKPKSSRKAVFITAAVTAVVMFLLFSAVYSPNAAPEQILVKKAVVVLQGDSAVSGTVTFEQSSVTGAVSVSGKIEGLDPSEQRGFHVHELGDLSNGCTSTGSHFNPYSNTHGAPTDEVRHVGDLGNIQSDENGVADISITDQVISLNGPRSIIGRAVVVHTGTDDLGRGGNEDSLKTGNAGGRAACGVIGLAQ